MKPYYLLIVFIPLFLACERQNNGLSGEVLMRVKDRVLTREEVKRQIPKNSSSSDSLIRVESIMKKWAIDVLMDEAAYKNLGSEKHEIDELVNEYKRTLMRHRFQERLVKDKVSADISEREQVEYYEANKTQFVLNENLIKGLFMKVPADAPGLDNVRQWYRSGTLEALEKIEKYSIQNAIIYDDFYDKWINFDEVMAKIPQQLSNPTFFLKVNNHLETSDSTHVFFLNIAEKLLVGNNAPYDYVKAQIQSMLANKRKINYLRDFGESLYRDAMKNGTVKYVTEN